MLLHKVWFDKKSGLSAAAAADYYNIFVAGVLRLLWSAAHCQAFRLCQKQIIFKYGVDIRPYIVCCSPTRTTVLNSSAIFLRVLAFGVDDKPDNGRARNAD